MICPYKNCQLCPRCCGVDREAGQRGYCGETASLRLAFAGIHRGEEPPITGSGGSGTIFVSGCNLGCSFCQNYQISQAAVFSAVAENTTPGNVAAGNAAMGRPVDPEEFADICLILQKNSAENINIVTGSHAAPAIAAGISKARKQGLYIPVLWNSSGFDGMETLEILEDIVDVYLPDLKTLEASVAHRFFNAPDYPEHAKKAILKMLEKPLLFSGPDEARTMISGLMVRHLIIPGFLDNTRQVLAWFAENCRDRALLSLMTQYVPSGRLSQQKAERVAPDTKLAPNRYLSKDEYEAVLSMLDEFEIDDGFSQELVTSSDWLPDFALQNPFPSELSLPIWHWHDT